MVFVGLTTGTWTKEAYFEKLCLSGLQGGKGKQRFTVALFATACGKKEKPVVI